MKKQWLLTPETTNSQIDTLLKELMSYSRKNDNATVDAYRIFAQLLLQRNISNVKEAIQFNTLQFDQLHDPYLMKDMSMAVNRIVKAKETHEKIMVYGDYDVDGTTSVALMVSFLQPLFPNLVYYIPDRYSEGYGVSFQSVDYAEKEGVSLIIALDCGIKANDKIDYANEKNIDYIICDHHTPGAILPKATAILDPKREDCAYPYKELSGCGIGFKLCQALQSSLKLDFDLSSLVDFMAISIACDIVPLTGENRVLAALGLEKINTSPRPSIKALLGEMVPNSMVRISHLVFQIGPKINAAGRIESGKTAVDMLLSEEQAKVNTFATQINTFNSERKEKDKSITDEALEMIQSNPKLHHKNTNVLFQPEWHKGVVGIVASRVIEKYYKPTIILTQSSEGIIGGSVRSVKGFDVYKALEQCTDHMVQFGGHKYAAGLTLRNDQLEGFIAQFESVVTEQMEVERFTESISYHAEIALEHITPLLKTLVDKLEPFGPQNMTPTFITKNVIDSGKSRAVGGDKSHLKLEITDPNSGVTVPAIAFGLGHLESEVQSGQAMDLAYTIDINYWNNREILQLMVKDIQFTDRQ